MSKSNTAPSYKRRTNKDWEQQGNAWLSLPDNSLQFIRTAEAMSYQLVLLGQLYEKMSNNEMLDRCLNYINNSKRKFAEPAGHYIAFVIDKTNGETHVFTNRLGTYHAYWSEELGNNAISTSYFALAKNRKDKKLDWEGITGFLAMGYFPDDSSYLQGIKIFEPASYYHFDSRLQLKQKTRYWDWTYEPVYKPSIEYISNLHWIIEQSLSVSAENRRVVIPISGGLDSRMLTGALTEGIHYKSLKAFSYGYTDTSPELKIAKQVADSRAIEIHAYTMPNYLFDKLDTITEAVELFQYVDGTRQASAEEWLRENSDVVVGGHWGDVWMDSAHITNENELQNAFGTKIIKRGSDWLLKNVCVTQINNSERLLQDYFYRFTNKYSHIDDVDFRFKIYKTDQWSFRWTVASLRMYQQAAFPILPFYDSRLVDLFCNIPTSTVCNRALQVEYIKQYYKKLAKIKWQEYDADLYTYKWMNNRNLAYRAAKKLQRTVSSEKTIQRNWEVFFMTLHGRQQIETHLLNNRTLNEIVPVQKTEELINDFYRKPTAAGGYTISMLLTFALFLEKIFES
ncbi:MAG: hypothetical protein H6551_09640 [Chitinophagales bacterium]|nr:hypothetical protein [Chitinophagaceae bacterium]MCB9065386.1 hypothetical protein [Chitinophagales bacterium]